MDIGKLGDKAKILFSKYKYAVLVLVIGLALMLLPEKGTGNKTPVATEKAADAGQSVEINTLTEMLESIQGAGKVKVMLSVASGQKTLYQTDSNTSGSTNGNDTKIETVIITDSQRGESGLITQINPATYLGAIVVCEGADSAAVRFAVTQAVSKITGLGTDAICVLKMK